jgi:hypothetical protein
MHLERVLASAPFRQAKRSATLLRFLVDRALNGEGDRLKEYTVMMHLPNPASTNPRRYR